MPASGDERYVPGALDELYLFQNKGERLEYVDPSFSRTTTSVFLESSGVVSGEFPHSSNTPWPVQSSGDRFSLPDELMSNSNESVAYATAAPALAQTIVERQEKTITEVVPIATTTSSSSVNPDTPLPLTKKSDPTPPDSVGAEHRKLEEKEKQETGEEGKQFFTEI